MAYAPAGINRRCNDCGLRHGAPNPCGRDEWPDDQEGTDPTEAGADDE